MQRGDQFLGAVDPNGVEAMQVLAPVEQVLNLGAVLRRTVEGQIGDDLVFQRNGETLAEVADVALGQLLEAVGGVLAFAGFAGAVALDRLGQDDRGTTIALGGLAVSRIHLERIMAAAGELLELRVAEVADQVQECRVFPEEVLPDVGAALDHVLLVFAIDDLVHALGQEPRRIAGQQIIPVAAPDHLDDIPTRTAELAFEVLDDLAIAAYRTVEALQVAVDDPDEVVEVLTAGHADGSVRFRFIRLAVTDEGPDHGIVVLRHQFARLQVAAEARLVDGVDGAEAHGNRRENPEIRHQERMRVGAETRMVLQFLAEILQVLVIETVLQISAGIVARRGMPLEVDHVGRLAVGTAAEEVVVAHFVQRRQRGEGRDVPAHVGGLVGLGDHGHGIPAHMGPDQPLHLEVAGVLRLFFGRDGVEVRRRGDVGHFIALLA